LYNNIDKLLIFAVGLLDIKEDKYPHKMWVIYVICENFFT